MLVFIFDSLITRLTFVLRWISLFCFINLKSFCNQHKACLVVHRNNVLLLVAESSVFTELVFKERRHLSHVSTLSVAFLLWNLKWALGQTRMKIPETCRQKVLRTAIFFSFKVHYLYAQAISRKIQTQSLLILLGKGQY